MSVTLYVWPHSRSTSWGHASLLVRNGGQSHYVSWWPADAVGATGPAVRNYTWDKSKWPRMAKFQRAVMGGVPQFKVTHKSIGSYQRDVELEGKQAHCEVFIPDGVLDEGAIATWWGSYNAASASYHSIKKNCCTTVVRALRVGGSDKLVGVSKHRYLNTKWGWEPEHIISYARSMNSHDSRITFVREPKAMSLGSDTVEMCTEHNQPLLECSEC